MHLKELLRILLIGSEKQSNVKSPSKLNYKIILFLFASLFVIVHSSDYKAARRSTKIQRLETNFRGVDAPHFNQLNRAVNDNLKKTSSTGKKNKQQVNKDKMLYNDSEKINKAIEYTINEENKVPYYLGNVPRDAQLTDPTISSSKAVHGSTTQSLLRYHFRPVPRTFSKSYHVEDYFKLNATTGDLYIFVVLDRDELCPLHNERPASLASSLIISSTRSSSCSLTFDVVVKPIDYIKIVKITVNLLDLNDNAPRFQKNRTTIEVAESSSLGYFIHLPSAEDHDTGINGIQEYQLVSAYNEFELVAADQIDDSIDVLLKLVSKLDREVCDHYEVTLIAIDGGRPAKSGFIDIEIKVIDSNDNPPVFEKSSYSVTVLESTLPGTTLLTVHATDKDVGANAHITYLLSPNSDHAYGDVFQINGHSGEILIMKPLDYETNRYYRLTVLAKNDDNLVHLLTSTVTVEVFVEDVNDNPPVISVNFWPHRTHAEVMENIGPDVFVALITVKDADSGKSGAFTCSVEGTALFRLVPVYSQEFKLLTNQVFDREEQDLHSLMIISSDEGTPSLSSSLSFIVYIFDLNDNSPMFGKQKNYYFSILENSPADAVVGFVSATDDDSSPEFKTIEYFLHDPSECFQINKRTGEVRSLVSFDRESTAVYKLIVTAENNLMSDNSFTATGLKHRSKKLSASVNVTVSISDVNDNAPVFVFPNISFYEVEVAKNVANSVGSVVARVQAVDPDDGKNAAVR
ncbi:hypothetical protein HELRODRAFT_107069 [Helobdella robusta]|uniref:Cadherin domain-containing protein n=1 Tax=Helobdella robusta TaxID=6412 RepID=T1EE71_HELRO|nr:hypothetical protein HELRODRAFT_107069 [Helobdella robusta]ESN98911.1 hypothetical protein HELRODRAFT_107069 [Helobdella robusta]